MYYLRYVLLWATLVFTMVYFEVPIVASLIVYILFALHGINEVQDAFKRWLKE